MGIQQTIFINSEIDLKLKVSYVIDLQKPEIDKHERAKIIASVMAAEGLSGRAFSKKYGFNKSTVEDWLMYGRISKQEYKQMLNSGYNQKEIYKVLRDNKSKPAEDITTWAKFDYEIEQFIVLLNKHMNDPKYTRKTLGLLEDMQKDLNRILFRIEQRIKIEPLQNP